MADVERIVKVAFEGDDRITPVINNITGSMDKFASNVQGVTGPLADVAEKVLKFEAALAALAVGGLAYSLTKSIEFENAVIELQKVIGDEAGRIGEAKQAAIDLSEAYGESSPKIMSAIADWVQAGYNLNDSMLLTKNVMDLVIAGQLESGEATEYLIGILAGFKAPATEAGHAIDVLNGISNLYATDVRQLAIGMQQISPIARLMGMDLEQTAGLLTPVIEVFRDGGEAAEALKTGLARIVDDRRPTLDTLAALGVAQKDVNGELRSGYDILLDVAQAFKGLSPEMQFYYAQNLVGIDQAARMVTALSALDNVLKVTEDAYKTQGSALQEVAIRLQSAQVAINQFKVSFENLGIAIGDQFKLASVGAIQGATAIEQALRDSVKSGTFQPVFDIINDFATKMGEDFKKIAAVLPEALANIDWSKFSDSIKNLGASVKGLFEAVFGDIDLTTAEGLQSAIQKVLDGIAALTNTAAGILQAWKPFLEMLSGMADKYSSLDQNQQTFAGNILGFAQGIDKILDNFSLLTDAIRLIGIELGVLNAVGIFNAIGGLAKLSPAIAGIVGALGPFAAILAAITAGWALDKLLAATIPGFEDLRQPVADAASALSGAADYTGDWIGKSEELEPVLKSQKTSWEELAEAIDALPETATTEVEAKGVAYTKSEIEEIQKAFKEISEPQEISLGIRARPEDVATEIGKVKDLVIKELPDGLIIITQTTPDAASITKTKDAINKDLPEKKMMEIMLQGDIDLQLAAIKASADVVQKSMEWKAKVDIAEIEAMAKTLQELSKNTADMFKSAGDTIVGLSGALTGVYAPDIFELMQKEQAIQQALAESQIKMNDAQIAFIAAKAEAMKRGDAMVTISADGLQVELEMVLQKIIQLTQIRANEEGLSFLLGV